MSIIRAQFKIGGVLTDMTTVKLSSSDTVYGVKRNDTSAVVVADNTAMTKTGTGIYEYTFTDPAEDLTYTYSLEFVYAGKTYYSVQTMTGPASIAAASYQAPGLTIAEIEADVGEKIGWSGAGHPTAGELARIDRAITTAGQIAAGWPNRGGRGWWWSRSSGTFPTAVGTGTYNLRTVNSAAMADLLAPIVLITGLGEMEKLNGGKAVYDTYVATGATAKDSTLRFSLWGDPPYVGIMPIPTAIYTVTVPYIRRHSKITSAGSADSALIVPGECHSPVYVDGSVFLLRHDTADAASLLQSPQFVAAMQWMEENDPSVEHDLLAAGYGEPLRQQYDPDQDPYR